MKIYELEISNCNECPNYKAVYVCAITGYMFSHNNFDASQTIYKECRLGELEENKNECKVCKEYQQSMKHKTGDQQ